MDASTKHAPRLPAALLGETRDMMAARPSDYRGRALVSYYEHHRPAAVQALVDAGVPYQAACSLASPEVRREAHAVVPPVERFAGGDAELAATFAAEALAQARRLTRTHTITGRRDGLSRLRRWGLLGTTIKAAEEKHADREVKRQPSLRECQEAIIRDVVPRWGWPHGDFVAPGLRGLVEVNGGGATHVWTLVADKPLAGAGGRFLDGLPLDARVRVFGVTRGSLMEAMLRRRGFQWSRYAWSGLRQGESVRASAWTWLYR
jgi:hypothetical protein